MSAVIPIFIVLTSQRGPIPIRIYGQHCKLRSLAPQVPPVSVMPRESDEEELLPPSDDTTEKPFPAPRPPQRRLLVLSILANAVLMGYIAFSHPAVQARLPSSLAGVSSSPPGWVEWRGVKPQYCTSFRAPYLWAMLTPSRSTGARCGYTRYQSLWYIHLGI